MDGLEADSRDVSGDTSREEGERAVGAVLPTYNNASAAAIQED